MTEIGQDEFIEFYSANLVEAGLPAQARAQDGTRPDRGGQGAGSAAGQNLRREKKSFGGAARRRNCVRMGPDALLLLDVDAQASRFPSGRDQASPSGRDGARAEFGLVFDTDGCSTPGSEILYRDVLRMGKERRATPTNASQDFSAGISFSKLGLDRFSAVQYARRRLKLIPSVWVPGRLPPAKF